MVDVEFGPSFAGMSRRLRHWVGLCVVSLCLFVAGLSGAAAQSLPVAISYAGTVPTQLGVARYFWVLYENDQVRCYSVGPAALGAIRTVHAFDAPVNGARDVASSGTDFCWLLGGNSEVVLADGDGLISAGYTAPAGIEMISPYVAWSTVLGIGAGPTARLIGSTANGATAPFPVAALNNQTPVALSWTGQPHHLLVLAGREYRSTVYGVLFDLLQWGYPISPNAPPPGYSTTSTTPLGVLGFSAIDVTNNEVPAGTFWVLGTDSRVSLVQMATGQVLDYFDVPPL